MKNESFAIGAVAAICAATISAVFITGAASPAATEPVVTKTTTVMNWKQIQLPLDSYVQTATERDTTLRAEYQATKACMGRFGLEFDAPAWDGRGPVQGSHYRLFGLMDAAHASSLGYHADQQIPSAELAYNSAFRPATYSNVLVAEGGGGVLNGVTIPDGGCIGEARRALNDDANATAVAEDLAATSWQQSNADSRVQAAFAKWSACMKQSGYDYKTPMDANNDAKWSTDTPSAAEKLVAQADVACKLKTNLTGTRMAVDAAYQLRSIGTHAAALQSEKAAAARQLALAKSALARR